MFVYQLNIYGYIKIKVLLKYFLKFLLKIYMYIIEILKYYH